MYRKVELIILLMTLLLTKDAISQISNSPLTQQGIGDVYPEYRPNNYGMAGIGISNGDVRYINNQNPALLVYNSIYTYSAGVIGESRRTTDGTNSQKTGSMNLNHLAMSFPIKAGKWVSSLMLSPYSNVNYAFTTDGNTVGESSFSTEEQGSQGLVQFSWANGIKIGKKLNIGVKAKYLFGSIRRESSNILTSSGVNTFIKPTIFHRDAVSDILFGIGAHYKFEVKKGTYLNLGVTYDFENDTKTTRLKTIESRNNVDIVFSSDTLINNVKGRMTLPSAIGFGISIGKPLKWLAGIDVKMQQWSDFKNYDGLNEDLQNSMSIAVGGEYTPDAGSVDKLFSKISYRLGASYEKTPYIINDSGINDFGINFGGSIPISGISSIDMGFRFGKRGDLGSNQLKENYFRLLIGLTFNDRLWFIKRKFN